MPAEVIIPNKFAVGGSHTCTEIICWGDNKYGQGSDLPIFTIKFEVDIPSHYQSFRVSSLDY